MSNIYSSIHIDSSISAGASSRRSFSQEPENGSPKATGGSGQAIAIAAILFTTIVWGISFISTKTLLTAGLTPVQIAFARFVIACAILGGLYAGYISRQRGVMGRIPYNTGSMNNSIRVVIGGILGIPVYFILENTGLRFTSASTASLITGAAPVINALAVVVLLRARILGLQWTGIVMSCLGVYVVAQADLGASLSGRAMLGNLLVFLSACSWVAYTIINKPLLDHYDGLTLNTYQNLVGTLFLLPIALHDGMPIATWGSEVWFNILYLGAVCSALGYILYLFALKHLGATVVTSFLNLVPFFGVLGGTVILGERLSWMKAVGGILAIAGVYLVSVNHCHEMIRYRGHALTCDNKMMGSKERRQNPKWLRP
ncbi:MAG TPA: DMT family transporter [Firmicutes bacterium]|nr:DMT family transporter [Bacillota bacterium]